MAPKVSYELISELLRGGVVTLTVASGAWLLAAAVGLILASANDLGRSQVRGALSGLNMLLRSVPQLVVVYLLFFGIGAMGIDLNPVVAAILALGVTEASFASEFYRAGFLTVPGTQRAAGLSIGLSRMGVLRHVVLPQTIPYVIPPLLNTYIGLLKAATLASAVGAPEILFRATSWYSRTGELVTAIVAVMAIYIVVTLPLTRAVGLLEQRTRARSAA